MDGLGGPSKEALIKYTVNFFVGGWGGGQEEAARVHEDRRHGIIHGDRKDGAAVRSCTISSATIQDSDSGRRACQ